MRGNLWCLNRKVNSHLFATVGSLGMRGNLWCLKTGHKDILLFTKQSPG